MIRSAPFVLVLLGLTSSGFGSVVVTFTRPGGLVLDAVVEHTTQPVEVRLINHSTSTSALSAYNLSFDGGDFLTGKLDATGWAESSILNGLNSAWTPDDQSLLTAATDYVVSGVTSSLSTPFAGPALPLGEPVLIGTLSVYIDAVAGDRVDFLINKTSEIDDQDGNLPDISQFGVVQVLVTPEPAGVLLALVAAGPACLRRSRG